MLGPPPRTHAAAAATMGAGASAPPRVTRPVRRPVTKQDEALFKHIVEVCAAESGLYAKRIQEAANFTCEFGSAPESRNDQPPAGRSSPKSPPRGSSGSNSSSPNGRHRNSSGGRHDADGDDGFVNSKGSTNIDEASGGRGRDAAAAAAAAATSLRAQQFADLMAWLRRNGAHLPRISVREAGEAGFAVCVAAAQVFRMCGLLPCSVCYVLSFPHRPARLHGDAAVAIVAAGTGCGIAYADADADDNAAGTATPTSPSRSRC